MENNISKPWKLLMHPENIILYIILYPINLTLFIREVYDYMLEYVHINVHSYPNSDWYFDGVKVLPAKEASNEMYQFWGAQPFFMLLGWPLVLVEPFIFIYDAYIGL